jgi:replicative DNA helicase
VNSLAAALEYAQRGWRVVPIIPGKKHPPLDAWQDAATTDTVLIAEWWAKWPRHGVGIATGARSNLFVLDVDVSDHKTGDETLADLEHQHGELPETVECLTGTGGRHLYFRYPADVAIVNDAGIRLGPGLDVRGTGGQVLAPPTIHPNGTAYQWEITSHPDDVDVADAPAWLIDLLTRDPEGQASTNRPTVATVGGWKDAFAAAVSWPEMLVPDGGVYLDVRRERTTGTTYEIWARPGINGDHASATLYYKSSDVLKVHTSAWGGVDPATGAIWGLDQGATYTRWGYYTARFFDNDFKKSAQHLRRLVNGTDQPDNPIDDVFLANGGTAPPDDIASLISEPTPATVAEDGTVTWPDPQPFGMDPAELPLFPLDALPGWVADHCQSVSARLEVAVDLPATLCLAALATAMAQKVQVKLADWLQDVNLYLVVALPPGEGKSPAEAATIGPLRQVEQKLAEMLRPDIVKAQQEQRLAERRVKGLEDKAVKSGNHTDRADAAFAALELENLVVPKAPQLIADDATPEKLVGLLADQNGRLALISDEGGVFTMMAGKYSDRANLDVYLKAWSGSPIRVDRVGRPGEHVQRPLLTVGVTVQPAVIEAIAKNPELAGRGLTVRFMYSWPRSRVGRRNERRILNHHDITAEQIWAEQIGALTERMWGYQNPTVLTFAPSAAELYADWSQSIEDRLGPDGSLAAMSEWVAKLRASVLRTAALLQIAHTGKTGEIPIGVLRDALRIGDYWVAHARLVHECWGMNEKVAAAASVVEWLRRNQPAEITARDVWAPMRRQFDTVTQLIEPLGMLVERGWLRPLFEGPITTGRRGVNAQRFEVHPLLRAPSRATARNRDPGQEGRAQCAHESVDNPLPIALIARNGLKAVSRRDLDLEEHIETPTAEKRAQCAQRPADASHLF